FFLYAVLGCFAPLCERRGDAERARRYREHASDLQRALEDAGWDGAWYRRAYYDDGKPLGAAANEECRIDALAQAWAVISRAAPLLEMLTPVHHSRDRAAADVYKVEPYVVAADVYGAPPHVGRGGWTWYTGSAGWLYRLALEAVLGIQLENGERLRVKPCIP